MKQKQSVTTNQGPASVVLILTPLHINETSQTNRRSVLLEASLLDFSLSDFYLPFQHTNILPWK